MPEVGTRILPIMAIWPPVSPMPAELRAMVDHLAAELAGGAPWQGKTATMPQAVR